MAAEEAARLAAKSGRKVVVVASESQQAALAALVEFDPEQAPRRTLSASSRAWDRSASAPWRRRPATTPMDAFAAATRSASPTASWSPGAGAGSTLIETVAALADGAEIVTVIEGAEAPLTLAELELELEDGIELELQQRRHPQLLVADRRSVSRAGGL